MIKLELADATTATQLNIKRPAYVARQGADIIGFCTFALDCPRVYITHLHYNDLPLADGLLRQVFSYAMDHFCLYAYWEDTLQPILLSLQLIENNDTPFIHIPAFFEKTCGGCSL